MEFLPSTIFYMEIHELMYFVPIPYLCRSSAAEETATYGLFCVFDGHNGVAAAQHIRDTLCEVCVLETS